MGKTDAFFSVPSAKYMGFPGGSDGEESAYNVGAPGSIPGSGKFRGEGNSNTLHYYCLENPKHRGAWRATVLGIAESAMTEQLTLHCKALTQC